jgi:UDP-glucose 4-epimerase
MRIAVTGGCGFIGSHVVDHLVDAGHEVDVIDLCPPHRPDVGHHRVDIGDLDGLVRAISGAEVVFHLAAVADVHDVSFDPVGATDTNVVGTAKVWEACRRNGVRRAVLASTVWVYGGASGDGVLDESAAFDLASVGHLYTSSKLAAELVAHSYQELYGLDFTILRYGIPYGPRMRPSLVIPTFVTMALAGEPIIVHGDGSQFRNYVYVEDLAAAHVLALEDAAANQVLNLEGREPVTVGHLVDAIASALDRKVDVAYGDARAGDYEGRAISAEKAQSLVGWRPMVSFDDGLRRYVEWHLAQEAVGRDPTVVPVAAPDPVSILASPTDRRRSVAVGVALGTAVIPLLATGQYGSSVDDAIGLLAFVVGLGVIAGFQLRWRARMSRSRTPVPVGVAAALAVLWLVSQAAYSWELVVLGGLLVVIVMGTVSVIRSTRDALPAGLATAGCLAVIEAVRPTWTLWAGAVAVAAGLVAASSFQSVRHRRPSTSVRWSVGTVLATGLVGACVGATSASASWFGPVVAHGSRASNAVALTFEGQPSVETRAVLRVLDSHGVRAAFFTNGETVRSDPSLGRELVRDGQLIGNAGYSSEPALLLESHPTQLDQSQQAINEALGVCPSYVRPPRGVHTPLTTRLARGRSMTVVTWDVGHFAHTQNDGAHLAAAVLSSVRPGSIIRLPLVAGAHSRTAGTVSTALPLILQGLRERHLRPVRLDELLGTAAYAGRC